MPTSADARERQVVRREVVAFTECGASHGCPFCIGRTQCDLKRGERIAILSGMNAGRVATVHADSNEHQNEFHIVFPESARGSRFICSYDRDEFIRYPLPLVPAWMCSLSIEDLNSLERQILYIILNSDHAKRDLRVLAKGLASVAWHRRVPVTGSNLFETLQCHGFPSYWREEFCCFFDFAIDVLVSNHSRPAIKRKVVPAMSIGRYATAASRELRMQLFGYDPAMSPFGNHEGGCG